MVRKQRMFGPIDDVRTLVEGGKGLTKKRLETCHIIGGQQVSGQNVRMETCHIGGQWVSGENLLTFLFFRIKCVPQLAEISEFNFNLVLSDIVAIKHLEKALCQVNFFSNHMYPSHLLRSLDLVIQCFCFSVLLMICFSFISSLGTINIFPRPRSECQIRPVADGCF